MARATSRLKVLPRQLAELCIGEIVAIDLDGRAHVRFPGSPPSVPARSVVQGRAAELMGVAVLLWFENGDPALPVVMGVVRDDTRAEPAPAQVKLDLDANREVLIDGQRLVFEAREEVVLRCGKSTIALQRDGKVLVRGTHVVSRSSGPNKIKGSSIDLN